MMMMMMMMCFYVDLIHAQFHSLSLCLHFVGKPKPVVCHINSCKFHRTCYTSTASAVFWQEDACQRKLEYDHTSSLNSADLSPKDLNSLPTSIPSKKSGALAFEELFGLRSFPLFFWQWESIRFSIIQTPGIYEPFAIFGPRKFMFGASSQAPTEDFFGPLSTSCFSKNKSDAEDSDKEFSRSGTIFWRKKFTISNQKSAIHTGKSETITMKESNLHLYVQFICGKLFRHCSYLQ